MNENKKKAIVFIAVIIIMYIIITTIKKELNLQEQWYTLISLTILIPIFMMFISNLMKYIGIKYGEFTIKFKIIKFFNIIVILQLILLPVFWIIEIVKQLG
mgnify:CR=1 FL=1